MNKNLFFWQKSVLFLNVLSLQPDATIPTIFQLFYAFQIIRFVKPSKIPFCFPFNFLVRLKTPTTQPSLEVWKQIIVAEGQVWRIRWMRKRFETEFMLLCLCNVRCVRWCIVIMKKDFFLLQIWPFLPDFVNQLIQYCIIICSSNLPSFLKVVDEDYSMCIPKNTSHNFPSQLLRCRTLWCIFTRFNPLFWPFTWFQSIALDPCFIHRSKSTQKLFRIVIKIGQILIGSGHTNEFLVDLAPNLHRAFSCTDMYVKYWPHAQLRWIRSQLSHALLMSGHLKQYHGFYLSFLV